jgi:hypothetical protein
MLSQVHGRKSDGTVKPILADDEGNLSVTNGTQSAAERNPDSETNGYDVVRQEANTTIIGLTTEITIGGGSANDTHLMGLIIHTALAGTCVIKGFGDSVGLATDYVLPAGSVGTFDFKGARNTVGALTITCSTAGDDNKVLVLWRPI